MTIPDFQTIMLPLLKIAGDNKEHYIHDAVNELAVKFNLTENEKAALLPSGSQSLFYNRVGWSRTHLKKAGLLEDPKRGYFKITDLGQKVLKENQVSISMRYLNQFPEYEIFRKSVKVPDEPGNGEDNLNKLTPEEVLESAYQGIRKNLAEDLLHYVVNSSPGFFEKLVVELLVKMGYGGSRRNVAKAVGQSGDEGIDGIIDEDRLGLDTIYIQAKNWKLESSIGRPEVQKFVGALVGKHAKKGVFITTTKISDTAYKFVESIDTRVVLINGEKLANLMIDYGVGVSLNTTYEIKAVDTDYFTEASNS